MAARAPTLRCPSCGQAYPRLGSIPVLLRDPAEWLALWRLQLGLLEHQGPERLAAEEAELRAPGILPLTASRCRAMVEAAGGEAKDVVRLLDPLVPKLAPSMEDFAVKSIESPLRRLQHLCRDWGWDGGKNRENDDILSTVGDVIGEGPLGRVLVLGSGACRLAYDLHRRYAATETVVLDIDPLLLVGAHEVVRGGTVSLTESYISVHEVAGSGRVWELAAPFGPLGEDVFHFLLADGLAPPFADETFDTVVTPWFIDIVPPDLRDFLGTLRSVLKPGGRWINIGPLLYLRETPLSRRYTREEIFELAARAGFELRKWKTDSGLHFVAPSNGRGFLEWMVAFEAVKGTPSTVHEGPPSWLILPFLPVPTFPGHELFSHDNALITAIVRALDGRRSIDELALALTPQVSQAGFDPRDLREAVRHSLAAFHPACRAS
jgi:SAM-dependent methyltransferase